MQENESTEIESQLYVRASKELEEEVERELEQNKEEVSISSILGCCGGKCKSSDN